jgi:Domain of unknown function (DUF932)
MATVGQWKALPLTVGVQTAFAEAAHSLLDAPGIPPSGLLNARRTEDRRAGDGVRSLWATANVLQENVMKGGVRGYTADGARRTTTRPVKAVDKDLKLNRALWTLASKLAEVIS